MIKKKGIRLGNQTSFSAPHFDVPFNFAFREKFSAFEFFPDKKEDGGGWSVAEISKEVRTDLKKKAKASDISLSLHLPWQANPLNEEFEALLPENIEFATEIGAQLVVVHLYCEEGIDAYIRSVEPLITETAACGMLLAIENTPLTSSSDFNLLFKALDEKEDLPTGHVGMCLDIGHANLQKSTQNDYLRFIDALDMHVPIIHGHVHENYGESDSHLTLFTGPSKESVEGITGMVKRLTGRGFDRTLIFEQWPEPPSLLVEAARKLTEIISSFEKEEKVSFHPEKPGSFVSSLLVADKKKRNWREKLDTVCTFLLDQEISRVPENISAIAIYLSFIGRGAVKMAEDGGHFRPSHHAKTASRVEKRLAQVTNSDTYFILQKIYPWLPSHDKKFTCAEPLTHIRDIAHRNDIPRDLKDEIKHTLQNKLHRCAGPEDLITSEKILIKITAPGTSFSAPFVEEFRVFHDELREFFNARSLDERLEQMVRKNEIPEVEEVRAFITLKAGPEESFEKLLNVFDSLTNLRGLFFPLHWKKDDEKAQHFRLTDIALDGYAFVVSSRINSFIEEAETTEWKMALSALRLLVLNIEFNKIFPDECSLITGELNSLSQGFSEKRREDLLRLKASLERIIRVADAHAERVLALFQKQAGPIGDGLKIQKSAVTFFSEGVIRGDLIFQLANLSSFLLKKVKEFAGISAREVLFPGECSGRLIDAGDDGFAREFDEPVILLASEVSGDEEIFPGVTAVVLKQGIPLLSHLGIRAREQGVVFVTCEDEQMLENISSYMGRVVHLKADSRNINIKLSTETEQKKSVGAPLPVKTHELDLAEEFAVIGLDQVSARNSGGKAFGLKTLTEVSEKTGSGFSVPPVLVLPFGAMEKAINSDMVIAKKFEKLVAEIGKPEGEDDRERAREIRTLIQGLEIDENVLGKVPAALGKKGPFIVRSSSNSEDLEAFAGAGLYQSVLNVSPSGLCGSIKAVFASLWSDRAVRARKKGGLSGDKAYMAVVFQKMFFPDISFVLHSVNPVTGDKSEVYMELALGHGEILTSLAVRGVPYRVAFSKEKNKIRFDSFSSFSSFLLPGKDGNLSTRGIDYSSVSFQTSPDFRESVISRISKIGILLERHFGAPQDIEGFVAEGEIYIVQSRRQHVSG